MYQIDNGIPITKLAMINMTATTIVGSGFLPLDAL